MNPRQVLGLWHDRWGKDRADGRAPLLKGRPYEWGQSLADWRGWNLRASSWLAGGVCLFIGVWSVSLRFPVGAQLGFSLLLIAFALLAARYQGRIISLTVLSLSLLMTARYFYWRFGETIRLAPLSDFVWSLGLCLAEACLAVWVLAGALQAITNSADGDAEEDTGPAWARRIAHAAIAGTHRVLDVYVPLVATFFFLVPMAFVIAGVQTLPTQLTWWLLMGAPHWVLLHVCRQRAAIRGRINPWTDVITGLRALVVTARTAWSSLRTGISRQHRSVAFAAARDVMVDQPWHGVLWVLSWLCVGAGTIRMIIAPDTPALSTVLYIGWCTINALMLTAEFAVAAERRSIWEYQAKLQALGAMVCRANGYTLHGRTTGFPGPAALCVHFSLPHDLVAGEQIRVSVFHEGVEFIFAARVGATQASSIEVLVDDSVAPSLLAAHEAMSARNQQWPRWLPGPRADQIMPQWLIHPVVAFFSDTSLHVAQNGIGKTIERLFAQLIHRKST